MKKILPLIAVVFCFLAISIPVHAATNQIGVYEVSDQGISDDDILVASSSGLLRSQPDLSQNIFGVVQKSLSSQFPFLLHGELPVMRSGIATVNVTTLSGPITYGDPITISPVLGEGERALNSGYIIGFALEGFDGQGVAKSELYKGRAYKLGTIKVSLDIGYFSLDSDTGIIGSLDQKLQVAERVPSQFVMYVRYFLAALIVLIGALVGYTVFARSLLRGDQAIKRNPAVKRSIQLAIFIAVALSIILVSAAIISAIVIIQ